MSNAETIIASSHGEVRWSRRGVLYKKYVPKKFANIHKKTGGFLIKLQEKEISNHVFSCEFYEILRTSF